MDRREGEFDMSIKTDRCRFWLRALCLVVSVAMFPSAVFTDEKSSSADFPFTLIWVQEDILRVLPDDSAPFVTIRKPNGGSPPDIEVLSVQGDWEEVRLSYWFKYNGSEDPNICKLSLFEGTFTGFRRIER